MVSAPDAEIREAQHAGAPPTDFPSKLPSAKQLIAAASSPRDRDNADVANVRWSDPDPSPKSQIEMKESLQRQIHQREHVVPVASSPVNGRHNGLPRPQPLSPLATQSHVEMDQQRAQAEAHLFRTMDMHTKDIHSISQMLIDLEHKVQSLIQDMHHIRQELHARPPAAPPVGELDDRTLEVFSRNLSQVATKANEVDNINVEMALIRRRVLRLEEQNQSTSPVATNGSTYPHREAPSHPPPAVLPTIHRQHAPQAIPPIQTLTAPHPGPGPERRIVQGPAGPVYVDYAPDPRGPEPRTQAPTLPSTHAIEADASATAAGGWTSVNQSAKRPSDVNGRVDVSGTPLGSPKRPKLAPLEPRLPSNDSVPHSGSFEEGREPPHLRPHSTESYPDSGVQSHRPSYGSIHDQHPDEGWRMDQQRSMHGHGPGGSPKRGGRGGGRGRSRKSGSEHDGLESAEWEREGWASSQVGPEGYYQPLTPGGRGRGGLLRRGSGGAHAPSQSPHAVSQQTVMIHPGDPYAHTKKSRQKPFRNADGVLIRKDGRPDMRSQSSAANLRKVHARKEEERQREWEAAQTQGRSPLAEGAGYPPPHMGERDSASQTPESPDAADAEIKGDKTEEQQRHEMVMRQMFPRGVEDSRNRIYGFPAGEEGEQHKARVALSPRPRGPADEAMQVDDAQPATQPTTHTHTPADALTPEPGAAARTADTHDAEMQDASIAVGGRERSTAAEAAGAGEVEGAGEAVEKE